MCAAACSHQEKKHCTFFIFQASPSFSAPCTLSCKYLNCLKATGALMIAFFHGTSYVTKNGCGLLPITLVTKTMGERIVLVYLGNDHKRSPEYICGSRLTWRWMLCFYRTACCELVVVCNQPRVNIVTLSTVLMPITGVCFLLPHKGFAFQFPSTSQQYLNTRTNECLV